MKLDSLEKLLVHELKDLYSAERQILAALPQLEKAATNPDLKRAFAGHRKETEEHISRIERVFDGLDYEPGGAHCEGAAGLVAEGSKAITAEAEDQVRDAALVAAAQRVEHYEMAGYGTAVALAKKLGKYDVAEILQKTLEEEGMADRKLTQLAEKSINFAALHA
jgi:ferritin-like metal-binding protein YciE